VENLRNDKVSLEGRVKQLAEAISKVKDANYKEAGERRALEGGLRQVRAELEAARLREGELEVQLKQVADSIKVSGEALCFLE
jgi:chromosome segregation ATPase